MKIEDVDEVMAEQIAELEKQIYQFESLVKPRYEKDKEILEDMREQHLRVLTIIDKKQRGEDVSRDEMMQAIPEQFR